MLYNEISRSDLNRKEEQSVRKPRYMEELLKIIFLWLGIAFIVTGVLSFTGVLKPTASSMIREPVVLGIVFLLLGMTFFIVQTALKAITSLKDRSHSELLISGTKISGTVEKVYLQKYTQYGKCSPYRIRYNYTYQGKTHHHKSHLLWDKPDLTENDSIVVYANDLGRSTIQL